MRRGCISLGEAQCDECHRTMQHAERYLTIDDEDSTEAEQEETRCYCVECALQKGYSYHKEEEKGESVLTFFPEPKY